MGLLSFLRGRQVESPEMQLIDVQQRVAALSEHLEQLRLLNAADQSIADTERELAFWRGQAEVLSARLGRETRGGM